LILILLLDSFQFVWCNSPDTSCVVIVVNMPKLLFLLLFSIAYCLCLYELPQYSELPLDGLVFCTNTLKGPNLVNGISSRRLMLMLLCASSDQHVLFGEDAHDSGDDFVVNDGLVVLADDVDTEFL
jgi:hypothetical protein